jgi:hypothetical protein
VKVNIKAMTEAIETSPDGGVASGETRMAETLKSLDKQEETSSKLTSGVNKRDECNGICSCVNAIV